ncbi:MAG: two pore domain potassium channel family protein [Flavobacteriales bacterium]|nr:two pore domain potassium channel family protein [Flavobacteriales bacterium]
MVDKEKVKDFFYFRSVYEFLLDKHYRNLLLTSSFIIATGTVVYHYLEEWSWVDSLYFSVVTLTTIGYGDFAPQTDMGKLFTIIYIILGLGMILGFINAVYEHYRNRSERRNGNSYHNENPIQRFDP